MADLKGSKTEQNLAFAFAGESQARNKYAFFAAVAKKEGYEEIARLFEKTADNEKNHARLWLQHLQGIGTTENNLLAAAEGEYFEWSSMYASFAEEARKEGFENIAFQFECVAGIERNHENRYREALKWLKNREKEKEIFFLTAPDTWECKSCGFIHKGPGAPEYCPLCADSKSFFKAFFNRNK